MAETVLPVFRWRKSIEKAASCITWGQLLEANDELEVLRSELSKLSGEMADSKEFESELMLLGNMASIINRKLTELNGNSFEETKNDLWIVHLKKICDSLDGSDKENTTDDPPKTAIANQPSLILAQASAENRNKMAVLIKKIGIKDVTGLHGPKYIDPYIAISVVDNCGTYLESKQFTPNSRTVVDQQHIGFGYTVYLDTSYDSLAAKHGAIFFEFNHYKPQKKKTSTKCFAFVETYEIKKENQDFVLELYKKPTDLKRKKLHLMSIKPLYLHIRLSNVKMNKKKK